MKLHSGKFNSGFVAIIGIPNSGKSTLLNFMLNHKISITSKKPQTTRNRILGVLTRPLSQLVFIDTPGIHKTNTLFNTRIVNTTLSTITDVDLILLVTDITYNGIEIEKELLKQLKTKNKPIILAINKIDKIKKKEIIKKIECWSNIYDFKSIVPICALNGNQVDLLISVMERNIPEGPQMFPDDTLTDMSEQFIVSEIIREKVFRLTGEEIPYSVAITIDSFKNESKKSYLYNIHASIHVERDSQKGIIIGKRGEKIKQISKLSRLEIQKLLGSKIFLKLFIRVQKNWSKDTKALKKFGY